MPRGYLLGLLLVFGLLAALYSWTTPLFEAPDEPWHYAYVRWLAEGHGLPRLDDDDSGAQQEAAQPPFYYAIAALISIPFADDDLPELFWHNPQFGFQAGGTANDNKNMLIHTDRELFPWHGATLAVRVARLVSLVFGLVTVAATFGLAREALPEQPRLAMFAASIVAFTPQFLFISGVISNDSAAAAASTCALWGLARIVRRGPTLRRAVVAGLALGVALLSKTSALLLLPLAFVAVCGTMDLRRCKWRETFLMFGVAALVGGWWYVRNWVLFQDPLGLSIHVNTLWGRTERAGLIDVLSDLPQVFRSFWGAFGWGHVELPVWLYVALGVLTAFGLVGWKRHLRLVRGGGDRSAATSSGWRPVSPTGSIYLLAAGWCLGVLIALLRWMQQVEAPHGRLLFPALGAWGLLLAAGWSAPSPSRRASHTARYGPVFLILFFFILSLVVPFAVIRPAFASPRLIPVEEAVQKVTPRSLDYDGQARLLGYRLQPMSVAAGGRLEVALCWQALRDMDQDYTLFIHILGQGNSRIGERTTYPGQGRFPTTLWPVGRAFCDSYQVQIAPRAPAPELYALEVGLYDAETGWRLPAQDAGGQLVAPPAVGLVRVAPAEAPQRPQHALSYDLGGQIALVGYDSSSDSVKDHTTTLDAGDTLTLTLYWLALQAPEGDYAVFVHVLDQTGVLVAQNDAPPRGGRYPTGGWQPGELVPDSHRVTLQDAAPPGPYRWSVGLYRPDTGERLPVVGPDGDLADRMIVLEMVEN